VCGISGYVDINHQADQSLIEKMVLYFSWSLRGCWLDAFGNKSHDNSSAVVF